MRPQETVERALAAARCDDCVVLAEETSSANLRWAGNTLTTNGLTRSRHLTVIAIARGGAGAGTGVVSRTGVREDQIEEVVRAAEKAASESSPAEDARPLLAPGDPEAFGSQGIPAGQPAWDDAPAGTGIGVFGAFSPALGEAFLAAAGSGRKLYGFAEHTMTSVFLGTSTGLRLRHDQPTGKVTINGKAGGGELSAWVGQGTRDFTDVDVPRLAAGLARSLGWAARRVELPAGRYDTLLSPSAMADLYAYLLWSAAAARDAMDGRTVFSKPGGGTRVGERLANIPVNLRSDPWAPGMACAPFVITHASGRSRSVFDNGLALHPTAWIRDGELAALVQTRHSAELTGLPVTPAIGNLLFDAPGPGGSLDDLIAGTRRGLLVTSLWYIREVDPQTLLLTGLTRDGVYLIENGEVTGGVNNFRFNESPVSLLGRLGEVGASVPALPREWGDAITRVVMPPARVQGFNMSSVSQAS